jgi:hypothetical protein
MGYGKLRMVNVVTAGYFPGILLLYKNNQFMYAESCCGILPFTIRQFSIT